MSQRDREEFVAIVAQEGLPYDVARVLMREATTLHRLAEASCNGDWPADNGQRKVEPCKRCEGLWVRSVLKKGGLCPDCRAEDRVRAILPEGFAAVFQGDPRGAVFKLKVPSGRTNDGGREGVCVPSGSR